MRRDLKFWPFLQGVLFFFIVSLDVCFQVEKVYFQQGFAVGSSQGLSVFGLLGSASVGF